MYLVCPDGTVSLLMATDTVAEAGASIDVSVDLSTGAGAFVIGSLTVNLNIAGVTASTCET